MEFRGKPRYRIAGVGLLSLVLLAGCMFGSTSDPEPSPTVPGQSSSPVPAVVHPSPSTSVGQPGVPYSGGDDPIAVVGDRTISRAELTERLLAGYGADLLRELMLREAVALESERLGLTVTEEELDRELRKMSEGYGSEAAFYAAMQRQLGMDRAAVREDAKYHLLLVKLAIRDINVPEAEIRRYYEDHKQEFGPRVQFELSWILTGQLQDAEQVLALLAEGADFDELARRYSIDGATAEQGGNLGWVEQTDPFLDAALLEVAAGLHAGEAAGPIQTNLGYAVLLLKGKKTIQGKTYEAVHDEIRLQLAMERAQSMQKLQQFLLDKYDATVLDPKLKLPMPDGTPS